MNQTKHYFNKICVLLVAFAILAMYSLIGVLALDDEPENAKTHAVIVQAPDGTQTGYETLYEAFAKAKNGATVFLTEDMEMQYFEKEGRQQKPTMIVENKSLTLDGQHHTVTAENKGFSMIEVEASGTLTLRNITLDGSAAPNRSFSNIINVEGGTVYIEDGSILKNNATSAVNIGTNVPGGTCVMNGGMITENIKPAGGSSSGAAVSVLEESTFILNDGTISNNQALKYGNAGIMVTRGGKAILNGGTIENNTSYIAATGAAVTIKGGDVALNGTVIQNNTSGNGYGAIYVTNGSSFGTYWSGRFLVTGGKIIGNKDQDGTPNAVYLWSSNATRGAYLCFSGSPTLTGINRIYANNGAQPYETFFPVEVTDTFSPTQPIVLDSRYDYLIGQTMVTYANGVAVNPSHFAAAQTGYGYQKNVEKNLLYTEQMRNVIFMDGIEELMSLSTWAFVKDFITEPQKDLITKPGYVLQGWYTDVNLTQTWDFTQDILTRDTDPFYLYAKWEALPAQSPNMPEEILIPCACNQDDDLLLSPDLTQTEGYHYTYLWTNSAGEAVGTEQTISCPTPDVGKTNTYTLTLTATRTDNGQTAQANTVYTISRADHQLEASWNFDENTHFHACTVCDTPMNMQDHTFVWVTDREPTYTTPGQKHEACTVCGYIRQTAEIPVTPHTHTPDMVWNYDDTTHWQVCTICDTQINQASHSFSWVIDREATGTKPGEKHEECTVCGFAKPSVEIPATGITDPTDQNKPEQPNTPENPTGSTQNPDMQETNTATHTNTENKEILQNQQSTTAQTIPQTGDTNTFWRFTIFILLCISSATGVILGMKRKAFPKQKHTQFSTIKRDKQ